MAQVRAQVQQPVHLPGLIASSLAMKVPPENNVNENFYGRLPETCRQ
jgi:hypothetical protein